MTDVIYSEGFPPNWSMVHRDDCTLLVRKTDIGFIGRSIAICAAPALQQGKDWLSTAQQIAHALEGAASAQLAGVMASFCDHCGVGPPCDEEGNNLPTTRALRNWVCDHCDRENTRPKAPDADPT